MNLNYYEMGIKKIARPLNKAKNQFIEWLENNKATDIDVFEGQKSDEWDYYRHVSAFIGDVLITVYFHMWMGEIKITYYDDDNRYENMSIQEFEELLK